MTGGNGSWADDVVDGASPPFGLFLNLVWPPSHAVELFFFEVRKVESSFVADNLPLPSAPAGYGGGGGHYDGDGGGYPDRRDAHGGGGAS